MNLSEKKTICQQVEIEVFPEVDVVVAGGGTAGVIAAIAAARTGAKVVLIERYGYLGGMLTAGNAGLTMYMKYSGNALEHLKDERTLETNPAEVQIAGGLPKELTEKLLAEKIGNGRYIRQLCVYFQGRLQAVAVSNDERCRSQTAASYSGC